MKQFIHTCTFVCIAIATSTTHANIVINEIDYDQPGTDTAEFIELFNNGNLKISLDGYHIELINGTDSSVYRNIDLTGFSLDAGSYLVLCDDTSLVMNCDYDFTSSAGWLQNGAPDAVALLSGTVVVDSLSYEGELLSYTEGNTVSVVDSNSIITSLSRFPNGFDSNDNLANFQLGCITPGTANSIGSGDCSVAAVSAVPLPPALWMFASGLLGLIGTCRKQQS